MLAEMIQFTCHVMKCLQYQQQDRLDELAASISAIAQKKKYFSYLKIESDS